MAENIPTHPVYKSKVRITCVTHLSLISTITCWIWHLHEDADRGGRDRDSQNLYVAFRKIKKKHKPYKVFFNNNIADHNSFGVTLTPFYSLSSVTSSYILKVRKKSLFR